MKPALPWTIALAGLLLLAGAMAWATRSLVGMESTQHRMAGEAAVQERVRLALWRMESIAASLVVEESARPPAHYRGDPGTAPAVSPGSRVLLHFELGPDGRVRSPQTADGPDKPPVPDEPARRLQELRARLAEQAAPGQWVQLGLAEPDVRAVDNYAWLTAANAAPSLPGKAATAAGGAIPQAGSREKADAPSAGSRALTETAPPPQAPAPPADALAARASQPARPDTTAAADAAAVPAELSDGFAEYAAPKLSTTLNPVQARQEQADSNKKEAGIRQSIARSLVKRAASPNRQPESQAAATSDSALAEKDSPARDEAVPEAEAAKELAYHDDRLRRGTSIGETLPAALAPADNFPAAAAAAVPAAPAVTEVSGNAAEVRLSLGNTSPGSAPVASDFRALWLGDALLLTRRVTENGISVIQGAWVDWPQLRQDLVAAVSDLFPAAALEPAPDNSAGGSDLLASLPLRFLPGRLDIPPPPFWSPLKLSLATAWGCVLLASAAVALVLRGMMTLSDRRAAFVSAVTHELRTPLATFKLYSEMLADGLVRDPDKRQSYLETLTTEADRLGHLVENVLSYSRLERGKGSDGRHPVRLPDLLHRVRPRIDQRVAQAGAVWSLDHTAVPDKFQLTTDPAAVEQILFNLVDNACKYARQGEESARIELVLTIQNRTLRLAVRDHGPGISRAEGRRLFRPFHKSARDAAHSAPGVGLGLSLCRRLARDLGGSLTLDHSWPHGASFVLTLPAA